MRTKTEEEKRNFFNNFYKLVANLPFWIEDKEEHKKQYNLMWGLYGLPCCCFNHFVGLPRKIDDNGKSSPHPMYEYENILFDNLINKGIKWQWVKKATGLGITEFYLRLIVWFCINERWRERFKNSQICIVVGPNLDLGKKLMKRVKYMFNNLRRPNKTNPLLSPIKRFLLDGSVKEIVINDVTITVFPSNHLDAMRGLPNVPFILVDEGDYFEPNEQLNVLTVTTRYVAKSDVWIAMVSTPGLPGGLFETIEKDDKSPFDKQFFDFRWGMKDHNANIFTSLQIENAQKHRPMDFAREYDLQYKGFDGNLFSVEFLYSLQRISNYRYVKPFDPNGDIYRDTMETAIKINEVDFSVFDEFIIYENPVRYFRILSVDPGYASSLFGLCIIQLDYETNEIQVIYENEFKSANSKEAENLIKYIYNVLNIKKITVDGEDTDFVRNLRISLDDYPDIEFSQLNAKEKFEYIKGDMVVIPLNYSDTNKKTWLYHLRELMYDGYIRIVEEMKLLYGALATIYIEDNMKFRKKKVVHNDVLDAMFGGLSLIHF